FVTITSVIVVLLGVMARYRLKIETEDPALIYYDIIGIVFPFPIIMLLLIVLLATVISTADSFFISAASSIVNDIVKPRVNEMDNKAMLKYSKNSVVVVSIVSLLLALYIPQLVSLWIVGTAMLVSGLLAPVLFGLYWKKATKEAGVLSMWTGLIVAVIWQIAGQDRKSTRLNSSHVSISYAVFCL